MKEDGPPIKPILYDVQRKQLSQAGLQYYGRALREPMRNDDLVNPWAIVRNHGEQTLSAYEARRRELEADERRNSHIDYMSYMASRNIT